MIIDGKKPNGKRISVSLDDVLWKLWEFEMGENARKRIKEKIKEGAITNSASARTYILLLIAKPSLADAYMAYNYQQIKTFTQEKQTDIEDI